ncbi:MAG: hypothetical protein RIB67_09570 [Miltoncostaeaceae bacterium]
MLEALAAAVAGGDAGAVAALYDAEVPWLGPDGARVGAGPAAERHLAIAADAVAWDPPQQSGAKAVLRWRAADGRRGSLVVEVRRGVVVFAAET